MSCIFGLQNHWIFPNKAVDRVGLLVRWTPAFPLRLITLVGSVATATCGGLKGKVTVTCLDEMWTRASFLHIHHIQSLETFAQLPGFDPLSATSLASTVNTAAAVVRETRNELLVFN